MFAKVLGIFMSEYQRKQEEKARAVQADLARKSNAHLEADYDRIHRR